MSHLECSRSLIALYPGRGQRPPQATAASSLRLRGDPPGGATLAQRGLGHPAHVRARAETSVR